MDDYYYKRIKVKGQVYMQVWKKNSNEKDEYVGSLGSARNAAKLLKAKKGLGEEVSLDEEALL